jgi:hypothetical protein
MGNGKCHNQYYVQNRERETGQAGTRSEEGVREPNASRQEFELLVYSFSFFSSSLFNINVPS